MQEGKNGNPLFMTNFTNNSCYNCEMHDYQAEEEKKVGATRDISLSKDS
jgi:hypothetical protein